MRVASVSDRCGRLLDPTLSERATSELLAIVLAGTGIRPHDLDALAMAIDAGDLTTAAAMPDEFATSGVESAITVALMAALELARRATLPKRPAIVRGPDDVAAIARRELDGLRRERVIVIVCDGMNQHQGTVTVSDGAIDRSLLPVREILNAVLRQDGRAFAVAHNHPCGDPEPSAADLAATRRIAEAARVVGLRFIGHVIVAASGSAPIPT